MNALAVRPALASAAARRAGVQQATRSAVRVRAEETSTSGETEQAWVAYTAKNGERKTVSPAEYEAVINSGELYKASSVTGIPAAPGTTASPSISLGDAMAFAGPAPEALNGRMAMVGFVAAMAAEFASGESTLRQLADQPTGVALLVALFSVATLIPLIEGKKAEAVGPFSPSAEMLNGRAAMLGFAALLVTESVTGKAFF